MKTNIITKTHIITETPIPRFSNSDHVHEVLKHRENKQKGYYDKIAHDLPPLVPEQNVYVLDHQNGQWKAAMVMTKCAEPRSYILKLPDGSFKKQNRVQIREAETATHKRVCFNDDITPTTK